ncbi:hypothetical protein YPPY53_1184, partial [Yersinia pestis PY-53]
MGAWPYLTARNTL